MVLDQINPQQLTDINCFLNFNWSFLAIINSNIPCFIHSANLLQITGF
jgi:hypothetical protein